MIKLTTSLSLIIALAMPMTAQAQTPSAVMAPYDAYNSAMQAKDYNTALQRGKMAWEAAEKEMGKSKTTGDLAYNYGVLAKSLGQAANAVEALERAVDLADLDREKGREVTLERSLELVAAAEALNDSKAVKKFSSKAIKYAKSNGLENSVFVGEILVHKAQHCTSVAN